MDQNSHAVETKNAQTWQKKTPEEVDGDTVEQEENGNTWHKTTKDGNWKKCVDTTRLLNKKKKNEKSEAIV